jgi:hypothetical protein
LDLDGYGCDDAVSRNRSRMDLTDRGGSHRNGREVGEARTPFRTQLGRHHFLEAGSGRQRRKRIWISIEEGRGTYLHLPIRHVIRSSLNPPQHLLQLWRKGSRILDAHKLPKLESRPSHLTELVDQSIEIGFGEEERALRTGRRGSGGTADGFGRSSKGKGRN